jgi:hypothetical protein
VFRLNETSLGTGVVGLMVLKLLALGLEKRTKGLD